MVSAEPGGRSVPAGPLVGGRFVISLDFELHWGIADLLSVHEYRDNLLGVREVVPRLLRLFQEHGIRATWATVGMLVARTKNELLEACPSDRPTYVNPGSSNYPIVSGIGENEDADPFHFGHTLAAMIVRTPGQELATHTFSHYFCLEPGQRIEQFASDLRAAIAITRKTLGVTVQSIVFPRNQFGPEHVRVCGEHGIRAYRGTPRHWLYRPGSRAADTLAHRAGRLLDAYIPICRCTVDSPRRFENFPVIDVPASRFLRPVSRPFARLESLRARRVCNEMEEAARRGGIYHLWWHPHNFGANVQANLDFVNTILRQYARLHRTHGMRSMNMADVADECLAAA